MPINPLWYLIPWLVMAWLAFRWRRLAGAVFLGLSLIGIIVLATFAGVKKEYDEAMTYEVIEIGDYRTLRFTNSHGERFTGGSAALAERMKLQRPPKVRVA